MNTAIDSIYYLVTREYLESIVGHSPEEKDKEIGAIRVTPRRFYFLIKNALKARRIL